MIIVITLVSFDKKISKKKCVVIKRIKECNIVNRVIFFTKQRDSQ